MVNGYQVTNFNEAPFYAKILSCASGTNECSICGSSWIAGYQLVTAAHCVDANVDGSKPDHAVYVYQWMGSDGEGTGQFDGGWSFKVETGGVKVHPSWNTGWFFF